jgi:hypothetical protein
VIALLLAPDFSGIAVRWDRRGDVRAARPALRGRDADRAARLWALLLLAGGVQLCGRWLPSEASHTFDPWTLVVALVLRSRPRRGSSPPAPRARRRPARASEGWSRDGRRHRRRDRRRAVRADRRRDRRLRARQRARRDCDELTLPHQTLASSLKPAQGRRSVVCEASPGSSPSRCCSGSDLTAAAFIE